MEPQAEIGRIAGVSKGIRANEKKEYCGHRTGIRTCSLLLSLFVVVGAAGFTVAGVAKATPQSAHSLETTPQPSVKSLAQNWQPRITVHVYNYAQVGANVLLEGEQIATDILRKAGVDTVWLACSAGKETHGEAQCPTPSSPLDLTLNLVTSAKAKKFRLAGDAYGFALGTTNWEFACYAWVFYDLLKDSALEFQLSTEHLLGNIIAHELGHLLLGANAHSSGGIMRGRWSVEQLLVADHGGLAFSNIERARIRNSVLARFQAQRSAQAQQAPDTTSATKNNEISVARREGPPSKWT